MGVLAENFITYPLLQIVGSLSATLLFDKLSLQLTWDGLGFFVSIVLFQDASLFSLIFSMPPAKSVICLKFQSKEHCPYGTDRKLGDRHEEQSTNEHLEPSEHFRIFFPQDGLAEAKCRGHLRRRHMP